MLKIFTYVYGVHFPATGYEIEEYDNPADFFLDVIIGGKDFQEAELDLTFSGIILLEIFCSMLQCSYTCTAASMYACTLMCTPIFFDHVFMNFRLKAISSLV